MKKLLQNAAIAIALIASTGVLKAQIYYATLPGTANGTSAGSRGPNAAARAQISEALYTKSELFPTLAGAQLVGIGFSIPSTTATSTSAMGNIKVYLENTTNTTNTKSATWATCVAPMSVVYNGTISVPAAGATATSVVVPFTTPFNYTGNGMYLAFEYTNPTSVISTTSTTYDCNTDLANGVRSTGVTSTAVPVTNTGALSAFRPLITWYFQYNGVEVAITDIDLPASKIAGTSYPVKISLANYGNVAAAASSLTLTIGGTPVVLPSPAIAIGGTATVNTTWTPATPIARTKFYTQLGYTGDINIVSDTLTTYEYAFKTNSVLKEDFNDTAVFKNTTVAPLKAILGNGWTSINNDGGTVLGPWFMQGGSLPAFDGRQSLNDNYSTANGVKIDDWLVSPLINSYCADNTDSLIFFTRSASSTFADSMEIRLSPTGGTTVADFTTLVQYINVPKTDWTKFRYNLNSFLPAGTTQYRIAFRYLMGSGGTTGANSDFIGLDGISIDRTKVIVTAAASQNTVCAGSSITLNGGGASTYVWTGGVTNGVAFNPSSTSTYTVTGTTVNGCTNTAVTSVTVSTVSVTANASPTSICPGGNTTLTGGGASTYTWTGGVTNGVAFNPPSTSTYTVTGTALNGCTNTASVTVSVVSSLTVTANSSAPAVCAGSSLTLTGGGASTYTWTSNVSDGVSFIPSATNTYTVSGASGACTGSAVVTVSVNANPTVGANTTTTSVCAGNNITLTGSGATTYVWTGGATNATPFAPSASTVYTVTGTSNGCSGTATVGITVNTNPVVTASSTSYTVCAGNNITLTGAGATTYAWTGGITDGVAFTPAASAVYTVTGSNSTGCTSTATVGIMVSPCTGIEAITAGTYELTIYPNPNNGDFTIAVSGLTEKLSVEIFNGIGQLVYKEAVVSEKQAISTNLADGVYLIKLMDSNKVLSTKKLIKQ